MSSHKMDISDYAIKEKMLTIKKEQAVQFSVA